MAKRIAILAAIVDSCDTASFSLFRHMSPAAVLSSALLHAGMAAALLSFALPRIPPHISGKAIEFTVDLPASLPAQPVLAAAIAPTPDDGAAVEPPSLPALARPEAERILPPLESPPSPLRSLKVAAIAPSAPPEEAPLSRSREPARLTPPARPAAVVGARDGAAHPAPHLAIDAGRDFSVRQAREDYLRQLVQKLSHARFAQDSHESARGLVVARLTVARDGRLVGDSLVKSSGFPDLDRGVMEAIRKASPFAPLPADLARDQYTFVVPINYVRDR